MPEKIGSRKDTQRREDVVVSSILQLSGDMHATSRVAALALAFRSGTTSLLVMSGLKVWLRGCVAAKPHQHDHIYSSIQTPASPSA
jgi:hypothetical protein